VWERVPTPNRVVGTPFPPHYTPVCMSLPVLDLVKDSFDILLLDYSLGFYIRLQRETSIDKPAEGH